MNINKIFDALQNDEMNSALGIILNELEKQGYRVFVNGVYLKSYEIFENEHPDLESMERLNLTIEKTGIETQSFGIKFIEYHKIIFTETIESKPL